MERTQKLQAWIDEASAGIETLQNWRTYLQAWQKHPIQIPDATFMSVLQELDQAGLIGFVDGSSLGLDNLRELVTEAETEAETTAKTT